MMPTALLEPELRPVPVEDFDNEGLFEIIDGQRVEMPPMSAYASIVTFQLGFECSLFLRTSAPRGRAVTEVLFALPLNGSRNRRPDMAYVSFERWPADRPIPIGGNAWNVVPDVAAEVVSPNDLAEEIMEKIAEYFQAGVRLVWVVYPSQRLIHVYEAYTRIRVLTDADELDGGDVLPGLRIPVAGLFPQAAPPASN